MTEGWPCPACGHPCPWPPRGRCEGCGVPLEGPEVDEIVALDHELGRAHERRAALVDRLREEAEAPPPGPAPAPTSEGGWPPPAPGAGWPPPAAPASGWPAPHRGLSGRSAQTLLAIAGVALLAVGALVFTAVAWARLTPAGQALVLLGATVLAALLAPVLVRRGLRATGESIAALAGLLGAVTILGARAQGAFGADTPAVFAYVAVSAALLAIVLVALGHAAGTRGGEAVALPAAVLAALVGPAAVIDETVLTAEAYPLGLALAAVLLWPLRGTLRSRSAAATSAPLIAGLLAIAWLGALLAAIGVGVDGSLPDLGWPLAATVVLAVALASRPQPIAHGAAGVAVAVLLAVSGAVVADDVAGRLGGPAAELPWVLTGAAVGALAAGALASALAAGVPSRGRGIAWGSAGVVGLVALSVLGWFLEALVGDAVRLVVEAWQPWRGEADDAAVAVLAAAAALTVAAALLAVALGGRRRGLLALLAGVAVSAVGAVTLLGGGWQGQALVAAVVLAGAAAAQLRRPTLAGEVGAGAGAVWLAVWSLGQRWVTVAALAAVALVAGLLASALTRRAPQSGGPAVPEALAGAARRAVAAAAVAGLLAVPVAGRAASLATELVVVLAAAVGAVALAAAAGGLREHPALAASAVPVAVAGSVTLASAAAASPSLATLATVGFLATAGALAAGLLSPLAWPLQAAAWLAAAATAALLADAGVDVVEAYVAVPVAGLGAYGIWRLRVDRALGSARALWVPLALGLVPTAAELLADPADLPRLLGLVAAAVALGVAGWLTRWGALVLAAGVAVAVVVATQLWVAAEAAPGWLVLALAGLVLVVVSATWERQLARLSRFREGVSALR